MRAAISLVLAFIACRSPQPAAGQSGRDDQLRVPDGFKISIFAQSIQGVRYLALGPDRAIYASQPASGLIVKLIDRNNDGVADTTIGVAQGLHGPFGIAFRGDTMYVAEERQVIRFDPPPGTCRARDHHLPDSRGRTFDADDPVRPGRQALPERRLVLQPVR